MVWPVMVECLVGNYLFPLSYKRGFPGGSDGKGFAGNAGFSTPGSGGSPGEENDYPPVFLLGELNGQRRLVGHGPWGLKESDMPEQLMLLSLFQNPGPGSSLGKWVPPGQDGDEDFILRLSDHLWQVSSMCLDHILSLEQ